MVAVAECWSVPEAPVTVTVTVRGGGGGDEFPPPPPPQPASSITHTSSKASRPQKRMFFFRERRPAGAAPNQAASGIQNRRARADTFSGEANGDRRAALGLVCMVSVEVKLPPPGVPEEGENEQVPTAEDSEQLRETELSNEPPEEVTVTV